MVTSKTNKTVQGDLLDIIVDAKVVSITDGVKDSLNIYYSMSSDDIIFVKLKIQNMESIHKFSKVYFYLPYNSAVKYFLFKLHPVNVVDLSDDNIVSIANNIESYPPEELCVTSILDNSVFLNTDFHKAKFDITNIIKKTNTLNPEIMFFITNDYNPIFGNFKLYNLNYYDEAYCISILTENDGLDSRYKYDEYNLGILGNLYLNLSHGSAIYKNNLFSSESQNMPINFSIYYNKNLNALTLNEGFRHNFQFKLGQTENPKYIPVMLIDPSGKKSCYYNLDTDDDKKIIERFDLEVSENYVYAINFEDSSLYYKSLDESEVEAKILYSNGSTITFELFDDDYYYPIRMENHLGDKIYISYSGYLIEEIYNTYGESLLFCYSDEGKLLYVDFVNEDKQINFIYSETSENELTVSIENVLVRGSSSTTDVKNTTESIHQFTIYTGYEGIEMISDLITNNRLLVNRNALGEVTSIGFFNTKYDKTYYINWYTYKTNLTIKTDSLNRKFYYYFDNYDRISKEMDSYGRTRCYTYDEDERGESHNLIEVTNLQTSSRNYITNHGFELDTLFSTANYGWKLDQELNSDVSLEKGGVFGSNCIKIKTYENGKVKIHQEITGIKEGEFKLNYFIKNVNNNLTSENFNIGLYYQYNINTLDDDGNVETLFNEGAVNSVLEEYTSDWNKVSTNLLTIPVGAFDISLKIIIDVEGSNLEILLDDFYFSSDKHNTRYNLVENGYMEFVNDSGIPEGWEYMSLEDDGSVVTYINDDEHLSSFGEKVFNIHPTSAQLIDLTYKLIYRSLYQTINCFGHSGDSFVVSSLCKANITENTELYIKLTFDYETLGEKYYKIPFSTNLTHWQMITKGIVAEDNYNSIKYEIIYNGLGEAYIDCVQLYKDTCGSFYEYDDYNNLTDINKNGKINKVLYNNKNQITEIRAANGKHIVYSYDSNNRLIMVEDIGRSVITYEYDTKNRVTLESVTYQTGETYEINIVYNDANKTYEITDANGNSTIYKYNVLNQTEAITYANGVEIDYEYDKKSRMNSISSTIDSIDFITNLVYDEDDELEKVSCNGRELSYIFDKINEITSTSIDGTLFKTLYYENKTNNVNHGQITKIQLGESGDIYSFNYSDEGNIRSILLNGNKIYEFVYDENYRVRQEIIYNNDGTIRNEKFYEYDSNNNIINTFESNGFIAHYNYDNLNKIQKSLYKLNNNVAVREYEHPYEINELSKDGFVKRLSNLYCDDFVIGDFGFNGIYGTESILPTALTSYDSSIDGMVFRYVDCYDNNWFDLSTTNSKRTDFNSMNNSLDKDSWSRRFIYNKTFYTWIYPYKRYYSSNLFTFKNVKIVDDVRSTTYLSHLIVNSDGTLGYKTQGESSNVYNTSNKLDLWEWNFVGIRFFKDEEDDKTKCFIVINEEITDVFEISESVLDINFMSVAYGNSPTYTTSTTTSGKTSVKTDNSLKMPFEMYLLCIGAFPYTEKEFAGIYSESKKYLLNTTLLSPSQSTILYDTKVYDGYDVITLNGSLESQNKVAPKEIFRKDNSFTIEKAKLFTYDNVLEKYVFGCFNNDSKLIKGNHSLLGYNLNLKNEGTISLKFRLNDIVCDTTELRCILSCVLDKEEKIGIYYNSNNKISISTISYDQTNDEYEQVIQETSITIDDDNWHHLLLTFSNTSSLLVIDNEEYNISNQIDLTDCVTYLGSTPISYGSLLDLRGYFEMFAFKNELEENPQNIINNGHSIVIRNSYDITGKLARNSIVINDNSYNITYEYNKLNPVKQLLTLENNGENIYDSIKYTYDNMGNVTSKLFNLLGEVKYSNTYTYDKLGRLLKSVTDDGTTLEYTYDLNGNITIKKITENEVVTVLQYIYDDIVKDKLIKIINSETEEVLYELKYEGNNIFYPTSFINNGFENILTWDGDKLKSFNNIQFEYDFLGNITKKINNNKVTYYYMDGNKLIFEVLEIDGVEQNIKEYIYNSNDEIIGIKYNNEYYFYVKDITGNIIGLLDIQNNFVVEYKYDDFGNVISITGSLANTLGIYNPFKYKGYYYDNETSLFSISSRYYSPELGRFIQPADVSSLNPHSINGLNLYACANNNPIGRTKSTSIANVEVLSGLNTNTMLSIFKLPVVNSNAANSNYWDPHTKGKWFDTDWPTFFSLSNDGFEIVSWGLSVYKGSYYFDNQEKHSIYFSLGNIGIFAGFVFPKDSSKDNKTRLGFDASANAIEIGYDGRIIDASVSLLSIGATYLFKNGKFEFGLNAGVFGWSVSIDFVELFKLLFGGE